MGRKETKFIRKFKEKAYIGTSSKVPRSFLPYKVSADAPHTEIGAVSKQSQNSRRDSVAYSAINFNKTEQGYINHERNLLEIYNSLHTWSP